MALMNDAMMVDDVTMDQVAHSAPPPLPMTKRQVINQLTTLLPSNVVDIVRALVIITPAVDGTTVFPQELLTGVLKSKPTGLRSATHLAVARLYQRLGLGLPSGARHEIAAGTMPAPKRLQVRPCQLELPLHLVDDVLAVVITLNTDPKGQAANDVIHGLVCTAPAHVLPVTQLKGTLAHKKHGQFLELVAAGNLAALVHCKSTTKADEEKAIDVASENGRLDVLKWLAYHYFPTAFLQQHGSSAPIATGPPAKFRLHFTKQAILGAVRHGHASVLDFWAKLFAHGVQVGSQVAPVCAAWPPSVVAEAADGGNADCVLWLLRHWLHLSYDWLRDGFMRAAAIGNVEILAVMIEWSQNEGPRWLWGRIMNHKVANAAFSGGHVGPLQHLDSCGVLSYMFGIPEIGHEIVADFDHLSRKGCLDAMDWCLANGPRFGLGKKYSEKAIQVASDSGQMEVLEWWSRQWDADAISCCIPRVSLDVLRNAVEKKDTSVTAWWLKQIDSGRLDLQQVLDAIAASASKIGDTAVLSGLLERTRLAGVPFNCTNEAMDAACEYGSTLALDWFLDNLCSGAIPVLRYSAAALTQASVNGKDKVLDWFVRRHVPFRANPDLEVPAPLPNSLHAKDSVAAFWANHSDLLVSEVGRSTVFELSFHQWEQTRDDYHRGLEKAQNQSVALAAWSWITSRWQSPSTQPAVAPNPASPLFTASVVTTASPNAPKGHVKKLTIGEIVCQPQEPPMPQRNPSGAARPASRSAR